MNNLQKDLEENTEKYNKSHQYHKKLKQLIVSIIILYQKM